jgi:hypothetical protein
VLQLLRFFVSLCRAARRRRVRVCCRPSGQFLAGLCQTMTLCHNMLVGARRSISRDAGVATFAEPHLPRLRCGGVRNGVVDSRGDNTILMPDTVVVAEVSVIHLAARRMQLELP